MILEIAGGKSVKLFLAILSILYSSGKNFTEGGRMNKIHKIKNGGFDNGHLKIDIDGKAYVFDLRKVSRCLLNAASSQRARFEISPSGYGIHWPLIEEDISIDGLLAVKYLNRVPACF